MGEQPRLFPFLQEDRSEAALLLSSSNAAAWAALGASESWPGGTLALVGPRGSGKSHMASAWASRFSEGAAKVVDDADRGMDDEALAFLLDRAGQGAFRALLVGRTAPAQWAARLPDLRSRFAALPVAAIAEPDEALLQGVLGRLCRQRYIKLTDEAAFYLSQRMERSFMAAHDLVDVLDREHVRGSRPVTVKIAARALKALEDRRAAG